MLLPPVTDQDPTVVGTVQSVARSLSMTHAESNPVEATLRDDLEWEKGRGRRSERGKQALEAGECSEIGAGEPLMEGTWPGCSFLKAVAHALAASIFQPPCMGVRYLNSCCISGKVLSLCGRGVYV